MPLCPHRLSDSRVDQGVGGEIRRSMDRTRSTPGRRMAEDLAGNHLPSWQKTAACAAGLRSFATSWLVHSGCAVELRRAVDRAGLAPSFRGGRVERDPYYNR